MHIFLWVLQFLMGVYFLAIGAIHFIIPEGLPAAMGWMYDLAPGLHWVSGTAEILGGLGLILPGLTKIQTRLTPLAGAGLATVMLGATVYHLQRGEAQNIILNLILASIVGFIAYNRWKKHPLTEKTE